MKREITRLPVLRVAVGVAALLVTAVLAGCAAHDSDSVQPTPNVLSQTDKDRITQATLDQLWTESGLPDTQRPTNISRVRYITLDEWADVMADCMTKQGAPTEADQGGLTYRSTDATDGQYALARYVCESMYPTDPVMLSPLNVSQLRYLYSYYIGPFRECIKKHGYDISEPPSEKVFVENYRRTPWNPLNGQNDPALSQLTAQSGPCPQRPAGLYGK